MTTLATPNLDCIRESSKWAVGNGRCWWYDEGTDWVCRISLSKGNGRLCVQVGPSPVDGKIGGVSEDCTCWQCDGYDLHTLATFLEFIVGVVGDEERLRAAFAHLIRCQYTPVEVFTSGSVAGNFGAVVHRWNWDKVPAVRPVSVDEIGC